MERGITVMLWNRSYYLWDIGCQMNRADARRVAEELERRGYVPVERPEQAGLMILNTCVVRQSAEDKVVGRLNSLKPLKQQGGEGAERALLVMGCFVSDDRDLQSAYPFVDRFLKPSDIAGLVEFVDRWEEALDVPLPDPTRSAEVAELVPISYGCDHHCTYCIVTIRRGDMRSRPIAEIVADVQGLVRRGAREITLLGQNVDDYGSDLPERPDLADVLRAIHDIEGLWRIRFLTSHPKDMTQRIIDAVAELPKVCPSWELALQSGDNEVLRRMARGHTIEHFYELMQCIRAAVPDSAVNTDIIVGFPGETEEQFEHTRQVLEDLRFDMVHIAAYSPRPGTPSARWEDDVLPAEKERRRVVLEDLQERIAGEHNARLLGQQVDILVDGQQRGRWRGRTRGNKLVFFESEQDWLGRLARVRVTWTGPWSMIGEVVGEGAE